MLHQSLELVECPRDAMQGWKHTIPTEKKIAYINALLKVGFHTIDFGSFVSPKAIPQMADTAQVIAALNTTGSSSKLLAIVANERGAREAAFFGKINCIGFPFSVSETFQQRNTNSTIKESLERVKAIQQICRETGRQLVIYLSMAFGNPYGDPYSEKTVAEWADRMASLGITVISLADTVGLATAEQVFSLTDYLVKKMPALEIGVHLHSSPHNWKEKAAAAVNAGCKRFDGALKGVGGCPMAGDALVGNMDTELLAPWLLQLGAINPINEQALQEASALAATIFN